MYGRRFSFTFGTKLHALTYLLSIDAQRLRAACCVGIKPNADEGKSICKDPFSNQGVVPMGKLKTAEELAESIKSPSVSLYSIQAAAGLGWVSAPIMAETLGVHSSTPRVWVLRDRHSPNFQRNEQGLYRLELAPDVDKSLEADVEKPYDALEEIPIDDLISSKIRAFRRKKAKNSSHRSITMSDALPFGVAILGDPHIDNDGCNMSMLKNDLELLSKNPHVWMTTVGDLQDNWIGRLGRLYANTSSLASDGWRLISVFH